MSRHGAGSLAPYSWGFTEVEFERDFLKIGKIGLRRLAGVFPDGTPFRMPEDDPLPPPLDVGADLRDERIHLALPLRRAGELEAARTPAADDLARQDIREIQISNVVASTGDPVTLEVSALRTRLLAQREVTEAYACIPLTRVVECRADQQVGTRRHVHSDDPAAARGHAADHARDRAPRPVPPAWRSAGRPRRRDEPRRGVRAGGFPDAAGDQPLRTSARTFQ